MSGNRFDQATPGAGSGIVYEKTSYVGVVWAIEVRRFALVVMGTVRDSSDRLLFLPVERLLRSGLSKSFREQEVCWKALRMAGENGPAGQTPATPEKTASTERATLRQLEERTEALSSLSSRWSSARLLFLRCVRYRCVLTAERASATCQALYCIGVARGLWALRRGVRELLQRDVSRRSSSLRSDPLSPDALVFFGWTPDKARQKGRHAVQQKNYWRRSSCNWTRNS